MTKKFEKMEEMFEKTEKKIGSKPHIDFKKSSVNKKVDDSENKQKRTVRIQAYLTESEFIALKKTMQVLEKPSQRLRNLVLNDIKKKNAKNLNFQ